MTSILSISRMVLLLIFPMITACGIKFEENFFIKVNADGSAELSFRLHRFEHWGDNIPLEGAGVEKSFGLDGVEKAAHLPICVDMVNARIPDIGKFMFHDISFYCTTDKDSMKLEARIPVGKNAKWMKHYPLLTQRYSKEMLISLTEKLGENAKDDWELSNWFFTIDMPGKIFRREVDRKGSFPETVYEMDVYHLGEGAKHESPPHILIHSEAAEIDGDAAIVWIIESKPS